MGGSLCNQCSQVQLRWGSLRAWGELPFWALSGLSCSPSVSLLPDRCPLPCAEASPRLPLQLGMLWPWSLGPGRWPVTRVPRAPHLRVCLLIGERGRTDGREKHPSVAAHTPPTVTYFQGWAWTPCPGTRGSFHPERKPRQGPRGPFSPEKWEAASGAAAGRHPHERTPVGL